MGLMFHTKRTITEHVKARRTFQLDHIHAEVYKSDEWPLFGRMPQAYCDRLMQDIHSQAQTYVFYSYETPIGWTTLDGWYIPDEDYTATTKHHKNVLRAAISS